MSSKYRFLLPFCAAMLSVSLPEGSSAQSKDRAVQSNDRAAQAATEFLRVTSDGDDLQAMQTAITRYQLNGDSRTTVDLIGAVHIGERSYYETLNELFTDYDAVLYELVAPEGTRVPKGGGDRPVSNPLSFLQTSAQNFLGLSSQLKQVDYTVENLRHADLSPSDLSQKMRERGESTLSLVMGALTEMMNDPDLQTRLRGQDADQGAGSELTLGAIADMLADPLKAKRFVARQFAGSGIMEKGLGSKKLNELIVTDRNKAAMEVLQDVRKEGRKKIAIFYGAAHMPDFEQRLLKENFRRTRQSWITAWDLTRSHATSRPDGPMSLLMQLMKELDR